MHNVLALRTYAGGVWIKKFHLRQNVGRMVRVARPLFPKVETACPLIGPVWTNYNSHGWVGGFTSGSEFKPHRSTLFWSLQKTSTGTPLKNPQRLSTHSRFANNWNLEARSSDTPTPRTPNSLFNSNGSTSTYTTMYISDEFLARRTFWHVSGKTD